MAGSKDHALVQVDGVRVDRRGEEVAVARDLLLAVDEGNVFKLVVGQALALHRVGRVQGFPRQMHAVTTNVFHEL